MTFFSTSIGSWVSLSMLNRISEDANVKALQRKEQKTTQNHIPVHGNTKSSPKVNKGIV